LPAEQQQAVQALFAHGIADERPAPVALLQRQAGQFKFASHRFLLGDWFCGVLYATRDGRRFRRSK
jgi:hypothetical protein